MWALRAREFDFILGVANMNEAEIGELISREVEKAVNPLKKEIQELKTVIRNLEKRCDYHELFFGIWRRAETKDAARTCPPATDA